MGGEEKKIEHTAGSSVLRRQEFVSFIQILIKVIGGKLLQMEAYRRRKTTTTKNLTARICSFPFSSL